MRILLIVFSLLALQVAVAALAFRPTVPEEPTVASPATHNEVDPALGWSGSLSAPQASPFAGAAAGFAAY